MSRQSPTEIAWIDTETSGLEADRDRIIEIAVIVTDLDLVEREVWEQKIKLSPSDRLAASPRALEVNGYNDAEWGDAPLPNKAIWERVDALTAGRMLGGQNVTKFDARFIAAEMMRFGLRPRWDYHMADTMTDTIRLMRALDIRHPKSGAPTASLEFAYAALGGPPMPAHRALYDIRRSIFVYRYVNAALREQLALDKKLSDLVERVNVELAQAVAPTLPPQPPPHGYDANGSPTH